jgi:hypothetical protein
MQANLARPTPIHLPATITVELEPDAPAGTCNLLFTQGMQDKKLHVSIRSSGDRWRTTTNVFVLGELASIALERTGCEAIQIDIESDPARLPKLAQAERPAFGLLNAWVTQGKARLR